jgi:hypothetical protein
VVNNHPPSRENVDGIVAGFAGSSSIACRAYHRRETIAPVDSWFGAIAEFAAENEAVFLLGDDDLMLPWGLQDRYRELMESQADMLLSDFASRIYFFDGGHKYWMTTPLPTETQQEKSAIPWDFLPADHPEASFMSNHCYRYTVKFRRGLELAFAWCDSQGWLARGTRTGMLPFYLPYTITLTGGRVLSLRSQCVIRGASVQEAVRSAYADGGNEAFYNLCAYDVFANRTLPLYTERLSLVCARFRQRIIRHFLTMVLDKSITLEMLENTFRHSGLKLADLLSPDVLHGLPKVAIGLLGMRGARLRIMRRLKSLQKTELLFQ